MGKVNVVVSNREWFILQQNRGCVLWEFTLSSGGCSPPAASEVAPSGRHKPRCQVCHPKPTGDKGMCVELLWTHPAAPEMVPHLLPASRSFAGVWASFGQVPRAGWSHWGASGAVRGRMQLGQAQKPAVLGDRGVQALPFPTGAVWSFV